MKSLKLIGLSLLALLALAAFAASASAEAGFLVGGNVKPKTANILGGLALFESESGGKIHCEKLDQSTVTFENDKHATATFHWLGCAGGIVPLTSLGAKEGELLLPVLLLVCLDPKDAEGKLIDEYGLAVEIVGTAHLESNFGTLGELKGTLLGAILTKGKAKLFVVEFTNNGIAGEQTVKECLEGANKKMNTLLFSINQGTFEALSVEMAGGLLQFEKATELMDS
jgi:hypothetical protein